MKDSNGYDYKEFCTYGKFNHPMAAYLFDRILNGDEGDDSAIIGEGEWINRFGKRLLVGDNCGFVNVTTCHTVEEAIEAMTEFHAIEYDYQQSEYLGFQGV